MSYTRWWHSLLISFSVATWGLAQPLYTMVTANGRYGPGLGPAVLLVMLTFHVLPVGALYFVDRAFIRWSGSGKMLRAYRMTLFVLTGLAFARTVQIHYLSTDLSGLELTGFTVAIALFIALIILVIYPHRHVTMLLAFLSVASAILTGTFMYQTGLLTTAWSQPAAEAHSSQTSSGIDRGPVFIVIFDGLSRHVLLKDGQIDPERFPNFAALGRDSAVFTNATSNYGATSLSIASLLSGKWISPKQPEDVSSDSVLTTLARSEYTIETYSERPGALYPVFLVRKHPQLLVAEAVTWLNDFIIPAFVPRPFLLASFEHVYSQPLWEDFLANISAADAPGRVYFVHILLPHGPYEFDRYGRRSNAPLWWNMSRVWNVDQTERAYEEQVMFVDRLLGGLTNKLKAERLYSRSLIVVTGDHGSRDIGMLRSPSSKELSELTSSVTLIIRGPGVAPQLSDVDYQHIDFKPTLWDVLKISPEKGLPGVSAFAPERPARDKWFWYSGPASPEDLLLTTSNQVSPPIGGWYVRDRAGGRWLLSTGPTPPEVRDNKTPGQ
ncbi:MAG: sulfatase-like hydrolase/transferase [Chloroflexi bacterium]|nr:sulfatase-like hydrolase/transferase [Chloroflexota bacterium]